MTTKPRPPAEHYREALRLLTVADNAVGPEPSPALDRIRDVALAEAAVHATLALAPRRARRHHHDRDDAPTASPKHRWLYGDGDGQ